MPDLATVIGGTARTKRRAADVLIVGHTHVPMYRDCEHGIIVNPGTLLRDWRDDLGVPPKIDGTFAVLETPSLRFTVYNSIDGSVVAQHQKERP